MAVPRNVKGWERAFATCRKIGAKFEFVDAVEKENPLWRVD